MLTRRSERVEGYDGETSYGWKENLNIWTGDEFGVHPSLPEQIQGQEMIIGGSIDVLASPSPTLIPNWILDLAEGDTQSRSPSI
jgi:hypothetical protein